MFIGRISYLSVGEAGEGNCEGRAIIEKGLEDG